VPPRWTYGINRHRDCRRDAAGTPALARCRAGDRALPEDWSSKCKVSPISRWFLR